MTICALMVVAVLGGLFRDSSTMQGRDELELVLGDICSIIDRAGRGWSLGSVLWTVPTLSTGEGITIEVVHEKLRASSGLQSSVLKTTCGFHTWTWDGTMLNATNIEVLDEGASNIRACSGEALLVSSLTIDFENGSSRMVFVSTRS